MDSTHPPAKRSKTTPPSSTSLQTLAEDVTHLKGQVASLVEMVHNLTQNTGGNLIQPRSGQFAVMDQHMLDNRMVQSSVSDSRATLQPFHAQQRARLHAFHKGYCFRYNKVSGRCNYKNCKFRHSCPNCQQKHPLYKCMRNRKSLHTSAQTPETKQTPGSNNSQSATQST